MEEKRVITNVYIWQNGLVMCFDQYGKQMPEYQGLEEEVIPKIRQVYTGIIHKGNWSAGTIVPMLD